MVREGSSKKTGETYAVKIVTKAKLTKEDEIALKDEIGILKELNYPNTVSLQEKLY